MSQVVWDDMTESPGTITPQGHNGGPLPFEQPPKLKGRRRLLQSLQRISSSSSLPKMGRNPSSTYMAGGKASISCVSLTSSHSRHGHSYGQSFSSQSSAAFSTAPTSVASTPGLESQTFDQANRIRLIDGELAASGPLVPKSVGLPADMRPASRDLMTTPTISNGTVNILEDYFTKPLSRINEKRKKKIVRFWEEMPYEILLHILQFLAPKEIVRCSIVSRSWHRMCFDGQLWMNIDTDEYYQQIPATSLSRIITNAGPFVRDLNLRGCQQMPERWGHDGRSIPEACRNIENISLEGCRIDKSSVHHFLLRNTRLVHINLSGQKDLTNVTMQIIARGCTQLEHLDISWCERLDTQGLLTVLRSCPQLKDLRAGEVKGFNNRSFLIELFNRNNLERLIVTHCMDLDDDSLHLLIEGEDPEIDPLTERAVVPARRLRHLDLSRCKTLTAKGVKCLAYNLPNLVGLQLSYCVGLTDEALKGIFQSVPLLTHLDLEELDELTNTSFQNLARSPCIGRLQHLNVSYCEEVGDSGMLPVLKKSSKLQSLVMDNTKVSDLVLTEAAAQVRARDCIRPECSPSLPQISLHVVVYDCPNVTWTGVREILARNTEPGRQEAISLKCFYGYQDTVNEHMKRVLRGDAKSAARLERKWGEYMVANEEAGALGAGGRRRRRRLREAAMLHADEEEGGPRGGRRRARSGGCTMM